MVAHVTIRPTQQIAPISLAIPVAIASGWIAAFLVAPDLGPLAYTIPFVGAAIWLCVFALYRSRARRRLTAIALLVATTAGLSLAFRQRELGDTGLDWQNGAKLFVWCSIVGLGVMRWRELTHLLRQPLLGLSFAFAAIALLSASWSEVPAYSAASAIGLTAYLILSCLAIRDLDERTAMRTILASLGAYLIACLFAGLIGLDVAWLAPSADETSSRLQGLSGHPNTLGQQAAIFITLTIVSRRLAFVSKGTAATLLTLGFIVILASGSRTNLVAALAAWAIVALRSSPWRHLIIVSGLAMLAVFLILGAIGDLDDTGSFVRAFSRSGGEGEIFTLTGRTELWATAWKLILEKPLLGWGYNGIEDVMARSVRAGFEGTATNAHNMLLQGIASLGFLGSLPAIAAILLLCLRFLTRPDPARDQVAVLLIITGLGEVGMAATPILLTLVVFYFFARETMRPSPSEVERGTASP